MNCLNDNNGFKSVLSLLFNLTILIILTYPMVTAGLIMSYGVEVDLSQIWGWTTKISSLDNTESTVPES